MFCFGLHRKIDLLTAKVKDLQSEVESLTELMEKKMAALDDAIAKLLADVAAEETEIASLETLAAGLLAQLNAAIAAAQNAGATPAQLQSLTDLSTKIEADTASIHAAVLTNTPSASQIPAPGP